MLHDMACTRIKRQFLLEPGDKFYAQRLQAKDATYQVQNLRRLRNLCPEARHILDIGANIGTNTVEYATWAQKVTSFEPGPETYQRLRQNILLNQQSWSQSHYWYNQASLEMTAQIETYELALHNYQGLAQLCIQPRNSGQNYISSKPQKKPQTEIEVRTLDSFGFTDIDCIKMDVEGSELFVCQGGVKTIECLRPIIQTEIIQAQCRRAGYEPQDLCDWFQSRDYVRTLRTGQVMPRTWIRTLGLCDSFWIPAERMSLGQT